jgi:hypothetical protein
VDALAFAALLAVAVLVPVVVRLSAFEGGDVRIAGFTPSEQALVNYLKRRDGDATQKEIAQDLKTSRLKSIQARERSMKKKELLSIGSVYYKVRKLTFSSCDAVLSCGVQVNRLQRVLNLWTKKG